jgi:hypothetical protein
MYSWQKSPSSLPLSCENDPAGLCFVCFGSVTAFCMPAVRDVMVSTIPLQRRLSFGSGAMRTPGRINMSRPSSLSGDSRASCGGCVRDCQLGQLHTAYFAFCKKVISNSPLHQSFCLSGNWQWPSLT